MATAAAAVEVPQAPSGVWSWITTTDHKRIGILYGVTAFFFFLVGGLEALIIRAQLGSPDNTLVSAETYNQLFTMHGTTMVFLAIMPLSAAFFNFIIPLQIGARDVAFPRLNAFSYWVFLLGGLFMNASFFIGAAPNGGWFGYANLTSLQYSPGLNIDFWVLGLQILGIASIAAGVNFLITLVNMRAPGMTMMRLPVFSWMALITQFLIVTAFPVITVALVFLMFDRTFGTTFFNVAAGGNVLLWQHLFWLFGHPEVYILILPPMGMVSDIIPTFSRKPLFGYAVVVYSGLLIAILGWGVWAHHMFSVGMGPIADAVFSSTTMLIAIPTGVKIFNWIATMWGGRVRLETPMLFAVGFIAMFILGGLSGVMHSSAAADLQQTDTYFVIAHIHYVLYGGAIQGIFAGIYYWWPKVTGWKLNEGLGKAHFWISLVGMNIAFFPMHAIGLLGMPRRIYTYDTALGVDQMNMVSTIGAFIVGLSALVFLVNVWYSRRTATPAGANPWGAPTLEWSMSSPPPVYNFAVLPEVNSRVPLWSGMEPMPETPPEPIHVPDGSYWPLVAALGIVILATGALLKGLFITLGGAAVLVVGIYAWAFEPFEV
jgi:cytochrome c oxidase subunit 1